MEYDSYDSFNPSEYLNKYYKTMGNEVLGLLRFLCRAFQRIPRGSTVLDFGSGPTLISAIVASRTAREIHLSDYSPKNLAKIKAWIAGNESGFDWTGFIVACLKLEGYLEPSSNQIEGRKEQIRDAVSQIVPCNIYDSPPLHTSRHYDVIISNYCLDAITDSKVEWLESIRKLKSLLNPGGTLILSSLLQASFYQFGETRYPNVYLMPDDLREALNVCQFNSSSIRIETAPPDSREREYHGVIFAYAED
jgi:SAM-dependent methyltransferase